MADLSDVEIALVSAILAAAAVDAGGCAVLGGSPVRVFRGSSPTTALTSDRATGIADITVFPVPDSSRNTTRWGLQTAVSRVASGISATASGQTASFSGVALGGELAGVLVNGKPFVYQANPGDSAALIAAALTTLVQAEQICWLVQATLTIPGAVTLKARTAGVASVVQEWARQEQAFRLTVWAPSPQARDAVCSGLSAALASVTFLTLADGTSGRLRYQKTASSDDDQVASVYRRDLVYEVEYATTTTSSAPVMLFGDSDYNTTVTFV